MKDIIARAYLEDMRGVPFGYGANDCALFVAGYLERILGFDPAEAYRGRYLSQEEGLELLGPEGVAGKLKELLDGPHPLNLARTGDIAAKWIDLEPAMRLQRLKLQRAESNGETELAETLRHEVIEDGYCVGIVMGRWVYTPSDDGPTREPLSDWKEIYRA